MCVSTQAYDTLSNPVKKKLYDSYASNVDTDKPEGMSYAEWVRLPWRRCLASSIKRTAF